MKKKSSEAQIAARNRATEERIASGFYSSENQSKRRLNQIKTEVGMAEDLVAEGYEVFSPTVVCDRVAIKDGKVYFVEFKKTGQELRPGQQKIFDLMPDSYIIRYK